MEDSARTACVWRSALSQFSAWNYLIIQQPGKIINLYLSFIIYFQIINLTSAASQYIILFARALRQAVELLKLWITGFYPRTVTLPSGGSFYAFHHDRHEGKGCLLAGHPFLFMLSYYLLFAVYAISQRCLRYQSLLLTRSVFSSCRISRSFPLPPGRSGTGTLGSGPCGIRSTGGGQSAGWSA